MSHKKVPARYLTVMLKEQPNMLSDIWTDNLFSSGALGI